ncbi:MAG TPA: hypothetical protein DCE56_20100 [Cyanobacteria bacterium UBA8553]|nr:hypothetical protein [Cyanobacteria bacterium UBA8553]
MKISKGVGRTAGNCQGDKTRDRNLTSTEFEDTPNRGIVMVRTALVVVHDDGFTPRGCTKLLLKAVFFLES